MKADKMPGRRLHPAVAVAAIMLAGWVRPGIAAGAPEDLGLQMASPVNALFTLSNSVVHWQYRGELEGADDRQQNLNQFTIAWAAPRDHGRQFTVRATIPVSFGTPTYRVYADDEAEFLIRQRADTLPAGMPFFNGHAHADNVTWDLSWGNVSDRGLITMFGVAGQLPTSTDGTIARDQYLLGPEVAIGHYTGNGVYGARLTHLVDVQKKSGENHDYDTRETQIGLFLAHKLSRGWELVSNPTIVYDWEGADGNKWIVPVGGGLARITRWGGIPIRWAVEAERFIESPDAFGPEWRISLNVTPVLR